VKISQALPEAVRDALASEDARSGDRGFPRWVWKRLGAAGLLGVCFPAHLGGGGKLLSQIPATGAALVRESGSLGLGLAWLLNELVGRLVLYRFCAPAQAAALLQALLRGEKLCALAVSEPGAGAHPKHMSARAAREGGGWRLSGEKAYVSNGPDADFFVVVAITGERDARKRFSAFLVPADCEGLSRTDPQPWDALAPLRHCGLKMTDCRLPAGSLLGEEGAAFETIAKPFRDVEDTLLCALLCGAMERQLTQLACAAGPRAGAAEQAGFGGLAAQLSALAALTQDAARLLERPERRADVFALNDAFRHWARRWQEDWAALAARLDLRRAQWDELRRGFDAVLAIAPGVAEARQKALGEEPLARAQEGTHEIALRAAL